MLSLLPQLLFLAPAGTALLRLAAGIAFIYIGYRYWIGIRPLSRERFPVIGTVSPAVISLAALLSTAVGVLLVLGLWTQIAAILGALGALKGAVFSRRYTAVFPLSLSGYLLLLTICLSLIVSGAGAFAFDLPL